MPMLVLAGQKASGRFLIDQGRLVATNVEGVIAPHGPEWSSLVRAAGFDPRVSCDVEDVFGMEERLRSAQRRYEYHCAVCQWSHIRRSKNQWLRCRACQTAGREGMLTITRVMSAGP
jgi:ribosomal protein L37AE/L43A